MNHTVSHVPAWVKSAVFYQIFPDRFARSTRVSAPGPYEPWDAPPTLYGFKGGDLYGVLEKLDYIQSQGFTALYFTPIFQSAANHRYHTYDYFNVCPLLGGNAALRELIDAAHARGMRVILDGVFNHTGRGFFAFHHILENGKDSPYWNWFHINEEWFHSHKYLGAYKETKDSHHHHHKDAYKNYGYKAWWDLPALPKLNTDNPAVRKYIFDVAAYWIRFGADGWRLDVPNEIDDDSFWQEFRTVVKNINPDAYIVGEIWSDATRWLKGDQFDAVMNYEMGMTLIAFALMGRNVSGFSADCTYAHIKPLNATQVAKKLKECATKYPRDIVYAQMNLLGSHDTPRIRTILGNETLLAFAMLVMMPGAPCLFYGDEIGMLGGHDPDCRRGFPQELTAEHRAYAERVRALLSLRHSYPSLVHGDIAIEALDNHTLMLRRTYQGSVVELMAVQETDANKARERLAALRKPQAQILAEDKSWCIYTYNV